MWGPIRSLALDVTFATFGVEATVTRPWPDDDTPIVTMGIWDTSTNVDAGTGLRRKEQRRVLALRRSDAPTVPRQTLIAAPLVPDGDVQAWRVDGVDRVVDDLTYVVVVPVVEP